MFKSSASAADKLNISQKYEGEKGVLNGILKSAEFRK